MWNLGIHKKKLVGPLLLIFFSGLGIAIAQEKIVGYYASWNEESLPYNNVEYSNLTHINVAFAIPLSSGIVNTSGLAFPQLVSAAHAAGVKMLISIGGADSGPSFATASADSAHRANFINSIVSFLFEYSYDGVDIDWETPSSPTETAQLTALIQEMRAKFNKTDSSWLITMAIGPTNYSGQHFDYPNLNNYVDWYNVMCYDFVGSWCNYSGHNSPLYFNARKDPNQATADSDAIVYNHSTRGIPLNKLVLGVPFYSDEFNAPGLYQRLTNSNVSNLFYQNIVDSLAKGWTYNWDSTSAVPWMENPAKTQFITFEDTNSIKLKVEYAVRQKLGGMMIWELSQDLYNGTQPLLETMAKTMRELTPVAPKPAVVSNYKLYDNYPNPFNPSTVISYQLSRNSYIAVKIYDVLGREVATLVNEREDAGTHYVRFDGSGLSSGVYFYALTAGDFSQTKKMLLIK